jgi:hypothetical protein
MHLCPASASAFDVVRLEGSVGHDAAPGHSSASREAWSRRNTSASYGVAVPSPAATPADGHVRVCPAPTGCTRSLPKWRRPTGGGKLGKQ